MRLRSPHLQRKNKTKLVSNYIRGAAIKIFGKKKKETKHEQKFIN